MLLSSLSFPQRALSDFWIDAMIIPVIWVQPVKKYPRSSPVETANKVVNKVKEPHP